MSSGGLVDSLDVDGSVEVDSIVVVEPTVDDVLSPDVVGSMGVVVSIDVSGVLVSSGVDVLVLPVLPDVVGISAVSPADDPSSPNMLAPESLAQPNGFSGPQLLLIPQPSDATGARSRRIRANMAG